MKKTKDSVHLYTSKGKYLCSMPYTLFEFNTDPEGHYNGWTPDTRVTDILYDYPIVDVTTNQLREMTIEERISSNQLTLKDGQIFDFVTKNIIAIEPESWLHTPIWDNVSNTWKEGAPKEEIKAWLSEQVYEWRNERFDIGFSWFDTETTKSYQQRARGVDRDRLLETHYFSALLSKLGFPLPVNWQFSDTETVPLNEKKLNSVLIQGGVLIQSGYDIMREWRNLDLESIDLRIHNKENFFKAIEAKQKTIVGLLKSKKIIV